MIERIYHGSDQIIEKPIFGGGRPYNDYGLGFYCTKELNMAKEWAVGWEHDGFANVYDIDCSELSIFDLNAEEYCILHWLAVLLENRTFEVSGVLALEAKEYVLEHFRTPYTSADIVVGYRADDSYFSFAQDFINGAISVQQLARAMHLGELGNQFVLKSKKAFKAVQFIHAEEALYHEWIDKRRARDRKARRDYFDIERNRRNPDDIFITRIIDEEIGADDPRLR